MTGAHKPEIITAAIDIQCNRIEVWVVRWDRDKVRRISLKEGKEK